MMHDEWLTNHVAISPTRMVSRVCTRIYASTPDSVGTGVSLGAIFAGPRVFF
jgi:hypothetical protein